MFFGYKASNLTAFFIDMPWSVAFIIVLTLYLNVFFFFYQKFLLIFFHFISNQLVFLNITSSIWFLINLY